MGKYSSIVGQLADRALKNFQSKIDYDLDWYDGNGLIFDYQIEAQFDNGDTYMVTGGADEEEPTVFIKFFLPNNPDWNEVRADLYDIFRHEIEHLTQRGKMCIESKYMECDAQIRNVINKGLLMEQFNYYILPREIDAMLQGLNSRRSVTKRTLSEECHEYLLKVLPNQKDKIQIIKQVWNRRCPALSLPNII